MDDSNESVIKKINSIRKRVVKIELQNGLDELLKLGGEIYNGQFLVHIELIYARFNKLKNERLLGLSKFDDLNPQENKLIFDILSILDIIRDEERAYKQLRILSENQNDIADLKSILTQLNFELTKESIHKLGECWSEIYQFEREFKKIANEFILHYLTQREEMKDFDSIAQLELEINSLFPIPPQPIKTVEQIEERKDAQEKVTEVVKEAYSGIHEINPSDYEYFHLKFQKLFEKFEIPDTTLERNKFWLPKELYYFAREYHNCYLRYMFFFKKQELDECLTCLKNMEKEKSRIEEIVIEMDFTNKNLLTLK